MPTYDQNLNRMHKPIVQQKLWDSFEGIVRTGLFFPAKDCRDLKEGLSRGKITTESRLLLFECEPEIMQHIRAFCRKHKLVNSVFFQMKFEEILLSKRNNPNLVTDIDGNNLYVSDFYGSVLTQLERTGFFGTEPARLDIFFPDFCGSLTEERINAMRDLLGYFDCSDTVFGFTFEINMQYNSMWRNAKEYWASLYRKGNIFPSGDRLTYLGNAKNISPSNVSAEWVAQTVTEHLRIPHIHQFYAYKEPGYAKNMLFFIAKMKPIERPAFNVFDSVITELDQLNSGMSVTKGFREVSDRMQAKILLDAWGKAQKGNSSGMKAGATRKVRNFLLKLAEKKTKEPQPQKRSHISMAINTLTPIA